MAANARPPADLTIEAQAEAGRDSLGLRHFQGVTVAKTVNPDGTGTTGTSFRSEQEVLDVNQFGGLRVGTTRSVGEAIESTFHGCLIPLPGGWGMFCGVNGIPATAGVGVRFDSNDHVRGVRGRRRY